MNALRKLLVLGCAVTLILPLIGLSGCVIQQPPTPTIPPSTLTASSPTPTQAMPQLAFAGNRDGKYALFMINIDGSGEKQITSQPAYDYAQSSWSPDGTLIAAESLGEHSYKGAQTWSNNTVVSNWGIAIIDLNNGTEKIISNEPGANSPVFSPYGNLIICDGLTTFNLGGVGGSISVSQPGKLGNNDMYLGSGAFNPSVSPEPIKIAFEANVAVGVALLKPSPTPTIPTRLDGGAGVVIPGQLGGGGTTLPYHDKMGEQEPGKRICVVDFDGTNLKQLTTSKEKYDDAYPTWSPDGKRIAFLSNRTGKNQIYVMNADGSGQSPMMITADAFNNHDPAWSPDGNYIAYVSDHSGISELCIIKPDGTGRTRINRVNELVKTPAWRPLLGQALGVPPTISTPSTPPVTTKPPTGTTPPATTTSTTGRLNISISGTNNPYLIYVNGAQVGKDSATLNLAPGSYRVTIYNSKGTVIKDETSIVIAGKDSIVKVSGAG